jgi:gluconolactonase
MDIQLIAENLQFPEGPIAMKDGSVVLTEIKRGTITRVAADGTVSLVADVGGGPNGAAIGPDGAFYITNNGGSFEWLDTMGLTVPGPTPASHKGGYIQRLDLKTGEVRVLYSECDGKKLVGPNDLVFDKQGGFWFTDHGCSTPEGRKFGAIYYAQPDGSSIKRVQDHFVSPNGVGLSPDEKTVYMADTNLGRLWAFDLNAPGVAVEPPPFEPARVVHTLPGYQLLDRLAVEASG